MNVRMRKMQLHVCGEEMYSKHESLGISYLCARLARRQFGSEVPKPLERRQMHCAAVQTSITLYS